MFLVLSQHSQELLEFLVSKNIVFLLITYILGKDSPYYEETKVKGENWDISRSNIEGVEYVIQLVSLVFNSSDMNILKPSEGSKFKLSEKANNSIKHPSFLKLVFKHSDSIFSELLTNYSFETRDFTYRVCYEITKYIEDISMYDETELLKLYNNLVPYFKLQDKYQLERFEYLIGFPSLLIEDPSYKYPYPQFGFHKMSEEGSKVFEYRSLANNRRSCCLLRKLLDLKREKTPCDVFLAILQSCIENKALLKYFNSLPAEEPVNGSFFNWGSNLVKKYFAKFDSSQYAERLKTLMAEVDTLTLQIGPEHLPNFSGFGKKSYLHSDVAQEIVSLLEHKDNIYVYMIEYKTSVIDFQPNLDYSSSKSNAYKESEEKKAETVTVPKPEGLGEDFYTIDLDTKTHLEKEFLNSSNRVLENKKKLIIFNNKTLVNEPKSTMIRFLVYNSNNILTKVQTRKPMSILL